MQSSCSQQSVLSPGSTHEPIIATEELPSLKFREIRSTLVLRNRGRLMPWLGMALKGLLARPLKDNCCVLPKQNRQSRCSGCDQIEKCFYGRIFEQGQINKGFMGQANQSIRPITLAVTNPKVNLNNGVNPNHGAAEIEAIPGDRLELQMLLFGHDAINLEYGFRQTLIECGFKRGFGMGRSKVGFELGSWESKEYKLRVPQDLAGAPSDGRRIKKVLLTAESPILEKRAAPPDFQYFFQSSLRCMTRLFASAGSGNPEAIAYPQLRESARIEQEICDFRRFSQRHLSTRSGRFDIRGFIGQAEFRGVPGWAIPWLIMGGQIGVGNHRVCGAGRWRLEIQE